MVMIVFFGMTILAWKVAKGVGLRYGLPYGVRTTSSTGQWSEPNTSL